MGLKPHEKIHNETTILTREHCPKESDEGRKPLSLPKSGIGRLKKEAYAKNRLPGTVGSPHHRDTPLKNQGVSKIKNG
jgi:hypothetical protein